MIFTEPTGLWALACLALVLGLFLFKPKFTEHSVSTNYMWHLSRRESKRFRLSSQLPKWLILLMQMVVVASAVMILSGARLTAVEAGREYIFLIDSSASMNQKDCDGKSAFERACDRVIEKTANMPGGSHVTVLLSGEEGNALVSRQDTPKLIKEALTQAQCGWKQDEYEAVLTSAQNMLRMYPDAQVFFYTDHAFENVENIEVVSVLDEKMWNVGIECLQSVISSSGTTFHAAVHCTGTTQTLPVALYVDNKLASAQMVTFEDNREQTVTFFQSGLREFDTARVMVDVQDGLDEDNTFCCFGPIDGGGKILLVGSKTFYWQHALEAFGIYTVNWEDPVSSKTVNGYDIYIYDGYIPEILPEDGAVWLVNPPQVPDGIELRLGDRVRGASLSVAHGVENERMLRLTQSISAGDISVLQLTETTDVGMFTPLLMCGELPALLVGESDKGAPVFVMNFDVHHSNLPLLSDFLILIGHMLDYSLPKMLEKDWCYVGDAVTYTDVPFTCQTQLAAPDGKTEPVYGGAFTPDRPGVYTLHQQTEEGEQKQERIYACLNERELMRKNDTETALLLSQPSDDDAAAKIAQNQRDRGLDLTPLMAWLFLICLTLECVVYHREQV